MNKRKVNLLEKHYLWHIRRINRMLDRFPKWNLSKNIENHEMTFEQFNKKSTTAAESLKAHTSF